ncbi:MAG: pyridoxamine 5'-phosphate oxidase family protein [Rhizobiaceae bacterium]|nr:pyridoxamine 5'-phosphate oxidase family protein [Rhizobiaceae bacterium]
MHIKSLSEAECFSFLESNRLARLCCSAENQPYAIPLHYAFKNHFIYAFSMPGRKIDMMRKNPRVALLVDELKAGRNWKSIVAEGVFEELPNRIGFKIERDHAWSLLSQHANWWEPGAIKPDMSVPLDDTKHIFFRVAIDRISGREGAA